MSNAVIFLELGILCFLVSDTADIAFGPETRLDWIFKVAGYAAGFIGIYLHRSGKILRNR